MSGDSRNSRRTPDSSTNPLKTQGRQCFRSVHRAALADVVIAHRQRDPTQQRGLFVTADARSMRSVSHSTTVVAPSSSTTMSASTFRINGPIDHRCTCPGYTHAVRDVGASLVVRGAAPHSSRWCRCPGTTRPVAANPPDGAQFTARCPACGRSPRCVRVLRSRRRCRASVVARRPRRRDVRRRAGPR